MTIGALQKLSLTAYPGRLSCQVFLLGCNWQCPWCDAIEFIDQERIKQKQQMPERHFFQFLKQSRGAFQGVVLSGGEPAMQNGLPKFCRQIKKLGFEIKLDTNGSFPETLGVLISQGIVDYVALDIKAPKAKYAQAIGLQGNSINFVLNKIEQSISLIKQSQVDYEFCATLTPLLTKQDIWQIAQWVKPAKRFRLQAFRPRNTLHPNFSVFEPTSPAELFGIQQAISPFFDDIV